MLGDDQELWLRDRLAGETGDLAGCSSVPPAARWARGAAGRICDEVGEVLGCEDWHGRAEAHEHIVEALLLRRRLLEIRSRSQLAKQGETLAVGIDAAVARAVSIMAVSDFSGCYRRKYYPGD